MSKSYSKLRHIQESNILLELKRLNEQIAGGNTNASPDKTSFENVNVTKTSNNLFKLGSDEINTNSDDFKDAVQKITFAVGMNPKARIEVQGGASAVPFGGKSVEGSRKDNENLANRRAAKFIDALKKQGVKANFEIVKGQVGTATKANSDEANQEQFVRYSYPSDELVGRVDLGRDNTAVKDPLLRGRKIEKIYTDTDEETTTVKIQLTGPKRKVYDAVGMISVYAKKNGISYKGIK